MCRLSGAAGRNAVAARGGTEHCSSAYAGARMSSPERCHTPSVGSISAYSNRRIRLALLRARVAGRPYGATTPRPVPLGQGSSVDGPTSRNRIALPTDKPWRKHAQIRLGTGRPGIAWTTCMEMNGGNNAQPKEAAEDYPGVFDKGRPAADPVSAGHQCRREARPGKGGGQ